MSSGYPEEIKTAAKMMYLRGVPMRTITKDLALNSERVLYQWRDKGGWDAMLQHETVEVATSRRLIALIQNENKVDADYKEITHLSNLQDKLANIDLKKARTAKEVGRANQKGEKSKGKRASKKNEIGFIEEDELKEIREKLFYQYQLNWYDNKCQRTRFILKSRQIGATYYFAWEAFEDAVITGDDQIFLSASKNQAMIFKSYILRFAKEYFDVELKGAESIELMKDGKPWATFRFVSTNAATAQGYHGHLYVDEVFWIPDFQKLNKLASGMAAHKKWRKSYMSVPSVKSHGAFAMWNGDIYNKKRKNKVDFDLSHKNIRGGKLGPDKIWRDIVTVKDAENHGCDLFDIESLQEEYTKVEFNTLFMCAFMEAGSSVFNLNDLLNCAVDSNVVWVDFNKKKVIPFGRNPVWIGYDPARRGDRSSVVVIAPSLTENGKFRMLEKLSLKGTFKHQAAEIKALCDKYHVVFMGIDCTGVGLGVVDLVREFFPLVQPIHYAVDTKTRLVLKAVDIIESNRMEWDAEHTDIPQAFLQVYQTTTRTGQITYEANRESETGHADVAWAIMHALSNEPLNGKQQFASVGFAR